MSQRKRNVRRLADLLAESADANTATFHLNGGPVDLIDWTAVANELLDHLTVGVK